MKSNQRVKKLLLLSSSSSPSPTKTPNKTLSSSPTMITKKTRSSTTKTPKQLSSPTKTPKKPLSSPTITTKKTRSSTTKTLRKRLSPPPTKIPKKKLLSSPTKTPKKTLSSSPTKTLNKTSLSTKTPKNKNKKKTLSNKECLDLALQRLSSNSTPESLPCRGSQFTDIFNYIENKLIEGNGGCMYISGVPGTGKTATVREVKRKLEADSKYPAFKWIEVNGLKLSDPYQCYVHILHELTGEKRSSEAAADTLNDRFSDCDPDHEFVILFVDELDLLRTRKQNILYHLFDWPTRHNSKLIVLAIANSMDLPEKLMINRVASRIGLTRLAFHPYSWQELESIITSRLTGLLHVFDSDALKLISRKVAAVSGDARRALDICRLAVQTAQLTAAAAADDEDDQQQQELQSTVSMESVDQALKEIFNSLKLVRIRLAPLQEQVFLQAVCQDFRISGVEEANFIDVYQHHIEICRFEGHYIPSTVELEKIAYNLHTSRLIIVEKSVSHLFKKIRLNISVDDINFALKMS
ncbi:origin recognition complex subunit 1-like [Oppia nitens]|uniref:origin recognition complex subunit 1-like n=1 Tax=Oppia nitens TaxID=1686743 RepID=UPI0023D99E7D|nr:origin recognition complex subunit 1-like [Oppia nitens]